MTDTDIAATSHADEAFTSPTTPATSDTDNDLLSDIAEINQQSDAINPDTAGDGFIDGTEVSVFTNPLDPNDHP